MSQDRARLVLFPGLGMGPGSYALQTGQVGAEVVVPGWVRPAWGETLEAYSKRMATEVPAFDGRTYLGGVSIGGAIALEAAKYVECDGVFLIASARSSQALPHLLRILGWGARWVPGWAIGLLARRVAPPFVKWIMHGYPEAKEILVHEVRTLDVDVWRWGAGAIMGWRLEGRLRCPVWQIHGDADVITPVYRLQPPPDVVVPGGGHMLNVTHALEVNTFVRERV